MSFPQIAAARNIRARYTLQQRRALGAMWTAFVRPSYPCDYRGPRRRPPSMKERRAAINRLAQLSTPNTIQMAAAMLPAEK